MDRRIEVIDGRTVIVTLCPPGPEPKMWTAAGKPSKRMRKKKLRRQAANQKRTYQFAKRSV